VANVTRADARPLMKVTLSGNVAAGSLLERVAVPE
jgi:hypothetical protein